MREIDRTGINNKIIDVNNQCWHVRRLKDHVDRSLSTAAIILEFLDGVIATDMAEVEALREQIQPICQCQCHSSSEGDT